MEAAGDAVFRMAKDGTILYASGRAIELVCPGASLVGPHLGEIVEEEDHAALEAAIAHAASTETPSRVNARLTTPQGALWMELQIAAFSNADDQIELLAVGRDISGQQETEERLRHMATHDALTGLPNRSLLSDRVRMAIAQSRRTGEGFALLALDLDGFKKVNDALGHQLGDALLRVAAARLSETLRDVDTLARVGGDEFVAVLPEAVSDAEIYAIARRMISVMQMPFDIQGHTLYIGTSIGAAVFPQHGDGEVKLLAHADTAMYRAKEIGKGRCVIYDQQKFTQPEHDVSLEAAMFQAVRNGEFLLNYQPIVDAGSRQIMGFEALMRWQRPGEGLVPPSQFIPMAESNGLINLLGAWALKAACVQLKRFEEAAGRPLYISVNVSPRQFRNDQFLGIIDEAMRLSGLRGEQLLLEITEGILMSDPEHAEAFLKEMVARNVRIAIDDFGTGYSSLAYLKRFPIATLKIDRAFIKDLPGSVKDVAICNVVLSLAKHLDLSTVAEGVENEAQLQFLARQGCSLIQGYLTGSPLLPEQALAVLKAPPSAPLKRVLQ
ncbi:bifunctional diguanylate cyclase/phosphodiesterase [Noviherbaspirillum sp. UKPF54]|uniref:putative bifunctional diguanylate cyclase/phosphodiesterase n=1 Tax=Noviherbaspirillum sp. UKPF54 TaxID=2601898 RepID=UPI0011B0FB3D|nr:EAL domain-containing protein [Noviherbaspirillum sp. UKPF54]QDZ30207.1 EAL domain-containing protein [Noviherbaspirillum sp. UKPF54]